MVPLACRFVLRYNPIRCGKGYEPAAWSRSVQGQVHGEGCSLRETCEYHLGRVNVVLVPNLLVGPGDVMLRTLRVVPAIFFRGYWLRRMRDSQKKPSIPSTGPTVRKFTRMPNPRVERDNQRILS